MAPARSRACFLLFSAVCAAAAMAHDLFFLSICRPAHKAERSQTFLAEICDVSGAVGRLVRRAHKLACVHGCVCQQRSVHSIACTGVSWPVQVCAEAS